MGFSENKKVQKIAVKVRVKEKYKGLNMDHILLRN